MIRIGVEIIGALERTRGTANFTEKLEDDATVDRLLEVLGYQEEHMKFIVPMVNGQKAELGMKLRDGDCVVLTLPVGGG